MNYKIIVTKVSEEPSFDNLGRAHAFIRVDFNVGDHGPFTERFPKETYDAAVVRAKLEQFANSLQQLGGY